MVETPLFPVMGVLQALRCDAILVADSSLLEAASTSCSGSANVFDSGGYPSSSPAGSASSIPHMLVKVAKRPPSSFFPMADPAMVRHIAAKCMLAKAQNQSDNVWLSRVEHVLCSTSPLDPRFLANTDPNREVDAVVTVNFEMSDISPPSSPRLTITSTA